MNLSLRAVGALAAVTLLLAACGDDDDDAGTTTTSTTEAADDGDTGDEVAMSPAIVVAEDQTSSGDTIVVASVTLPSAGFIAVHADGDGGPGPVIGHSELLPAGESTDVTITLDMQLTEDTTLYPMAHIDVDKDGVYDFSPPDEATDGPAKTETGGIAVVPMAVTLG